MAGSGAATVKSGGRYESGRSFARDMSCAQSRQNARLRSVQPVSAVVENPYDARERIKVTVNRRVDILEMERSHGRISEPAYATGQLVQRVFERLGYAGIGAPRFDGAGSSDPVKAVGDRIERMLESAEECRAMMTGIASRLGMVDTRLLRRILGDRLTFAQCAVAEGKSGDRGANYVSTRFRDALEDLSEAWASKGAARRTPDDKHTAAAEDAARRRVDRTDET